METFSVDIKGRVRNFNLPEKQPLMPIFEAVVNSIQAIAEKNDNDVHYINIEIEREETLTDEIIGKIKNVNIFDDGIGFNIANFTSFLKSDSTKKIEIGGKGVGRFSWLKAFDDIDIESVFLEKNEFYYRRFNFNIKNNFLDDAYDKTTHNKTFTKVKLINFKEQYQKKAPYKLEDIAFRIMQHCLMYFLDINCPKISIQDNYKSILLNDLFQENYLNEINQKQIIIKDKCFNILQIKVDNSIVDKHVLYLCAHNRLVQTINMSTYMPDLNEKLGDKDKFWYLAIVTSDYLDQIVDMNRLSFNMPEVSKSEDLDVVSLEDIRKEVVNIAENFLEEYLTPIRDEKDIRIKNYIKNSAPQFSHLLKYKMDKIKAIKSNLSNKDLDNELYKISRDFDDENKKECDKLYEILLNDEIKSEYNDKINVLVDKISSMNKSILANYVAHRKVIIDMLETCMRKKIDDKYYQEAILHNIIYPKNHTSDDIRYEQHNLWLIDERLSYFYFACSDIPFNNDRKEDRPDIMLFDKSLLMVESENDGTPYDNIVIFELKKPMRNDLKRENPLDQITNYMNEIKKRPITDKHGRLIRTNEHTKFYLYVVCDMLDEYRDTLESLNGFESTIDGLGMFRMKGNLYIEILTYDKIINDAKKRNKILFDKLGI